MTAPYEYKHIDPDNLPASDRPPYQGTKSECLRDALLDVIHVALDSAMTMDDVDAALAQVVDHVARLQRSRLKVLARE